MPKFIYDPYDWYWKADDGRIYSSKRQAIVAEEDADFAAWQGEDPKAEPQIWPRDDAGEQTDAEMQKVMVHYGLTVPASTKAEAKQ